MFDRKKNLFVFLLLLIFLGLSCAKKTQLLEEKENTKKQETIRVPVRLFSYDNKFSLSESLGDYFLDIRGCASGYEQLNLRPIASAVLNQLL